MHTQTGTALAGGQLPFEAALMQSPVPNDELTLTVASRLMQHYQAAAPVDGSRQIQASSDADGTPLLFSIGGDGRLYLMRSRDGAATGWELTDLSVGLPGDVEVRRFATARDPRGRPMLAAVCAPADRPDETLLFYTSDFSAEPAQNRWNGKGRKEIGRILDVAAGSSAQGEILLVITAIQGDRITSYRILPDSTEHDWKAQTLPFPENGKAVLGIAVGHLASLERMGRDVQGVLYTLYQDNAGTARLVLTSFPDTLYNHEVPVDADTAALALAPDGQGSTVLYTGGGAVWFYPLKAEMERDAARARALREPVQQAGAPNPVRALVADTDTGGAPEVWILRDGGMLDFSRRNDAGWSRPLPLESEVGEMASWRAAPDRPVELYCVNAAGELHHLTQDPATTNWSDTQIVLPSTRSTVSLASYASKLVLTDAAGAPVAERTARITASETTLVTVNGRAFFVGPAQAVEAAFDATGAITVTNRVNRLSTPLLRVEADFLGHALEIDPTADVHTRLTELVKEDPQRLVDATVTNARGEQVPLLTGKQRNVENVRVAYDVLNELLPVARPAAADAGLRLGVRLGHDDPRAAGLYARSRQAAMGNRIDLSSIPADWSWGVDFKGERPRFVPGHQLAAGFAGVREGAAGAEMGIFDDVWEFFGNLFQAVKRGLIQAGEFLLRRIGDVVEIWIDGLKVVLQYVEQVWTAIDYFFTEVLGTAIQTLLEWLGFIFNWGDILATHRALVAAFDTSMDTVIGQIQGAEPQVREFFRRLEAQVGGQDLAARLGAAGDRLVQRTGTETAARTPANRRDPASDWMYDQISGGGLFQGALSSPFSPELEQRVEALAERIGGAAWDTLRTGIEAIQQSLTEDFGRLSAGELVQKVAGIFAATMLAEVETAMVSFLEVSALLLDALRELLKTPWDVPLLSPLYRTVTGGSELSGLDLACLIFAVPVTIVYKIATGEAPFSAGEADRLAAAPTHQALVRELHGIAEDRAAATGVEVSQAKVALSLAFGGVGVGVGRLVGGVVAAFGVGLQEASGSKVFRGIKMTTDLVTYACAVTNLALALSETEEEAGPSQGTVWFERSIMLAQIAFPITDGIGWAVAARRPAAAKVVPWIRTAMGGCTLVAVTVLFILEAVESESVAEDDVLKFVENLVLASTQVLAGPASLAKDPRARLVFAIVYAMLGGLGAGLNIARATAVYKQGKLFRPI